MSMSTINPEAPTIPNRSVERGREQFLDRSHERSLERRVEREPKPHSWITVAVGAVAPLGVSAAAAVTTYLTTHERVAMTAWIAVAVVGSASVISAAVASSRRTVEVDRQNNGGKSTGRQQGSLAERGINDRDDDSRADASMS